MLCRSGRLGGTQGSVKNKRLPRRGAGLAPSPSSSKEQWLNLKLKCLGKQKYLIFINHLLCISHLIHNISLNPCFQYFHFTDKENEPWNSNFQGVTFLKQWEDPCSLPLNIALTKRVQWKWLHVTSEVGYKRPNGSHLVCWNRCVRFLRC